MTGFTKLLLGALVLAGAGSMSAQAAEVSVYHPAQGLSYRFGSKSAVGYFLQQEGSCALSIFVSENAEDNVPPSAARLQFTVAPGSKVKLNSAEGKGLEIKCGAEGATLEVTGGNGRRQVVSRDFRDVQEIH